VTTLLESKARPYGSKKGALISMALHGALIAGAVVASGRAMLPDREKLEEHSILYVAPPPPKVHVAPDPLPEVKKPPPQKAPARAPTPPRMRVPTPPAPRPQPQAQSVPVPAAVPLVAPVNVPVSIPKVDLNALPTTTANIPLPEPSRVVAGSDGVSGKSKSTSDGDVGGATKKGGLGSGDAGKAYTENQVEEAVVPTRQPSPRYPESLRSVNVTGTVIAQFVVDQRGRVEPGSIRILDTPHKLFSDAVRSALLEARFRPARVGGNPVRQLVEQPFVFKLQ
jgi:TonB family protein